MLSAHADWPSLMKAIGATRSKRVIVTHGSIPVLVRYLTEQGINRSPRRKSGIAVRFLRMLRIRGDKPPHEANTLGDLNLLSNS